MFPLFPPAHCWACVTHNSARYAIDETKFGALRFEWSDFYLNADAVFARTERVVVLGETLFWVERDIEVMAAFISRRNFELTGLERDDARFNVVKSLSDRAW